jgi:rhamnogalacturonan endolyase
MNTKDTYYNGPKWSDLTVDGIVYNYISECRTLILPPSTTTDVPVSNHHGNGNPDTRNFDRTFGPVRTLLRLPLS